jgi:hypothetical protein
MNLRRKVVQNGYFIASICECNGECTTYEASAASDENFHFECPYSKKISGLGSWKAVPLRRALFMLAMKCVLMVTAI